MQTPTVGRIVHYFSASDEQSLRQPIAAIVTAIHSPGVVALTIFLTDHPPSQRHAVQHRAMVDDNDAYWDWPEVVPFYQPVSSGSITVPSPQFPNTVVTMGAGDPIRPTPQNICDDGPTFKQFNENQV